MASSNPDLQQAVRNIHRKRVEEGSPSVRSTISMASDGQISKLGIEDGSEPLSSIWPYLDLWL